MRKEILKNTFWGNLNILTRYSTSFIATAVIASQFDPSMFGTYQLVITYLGIIESINFLSPNHLRNYLVSHPDDEGAIGKIWFLQGLGLWLVSSFIAAIFLAMTDQKLLWSLVLLGNLRILMRSWDYIPIVLDHRLRSDLSQKIQIAQQGIYNIGRIFLAVVGAGLTALVAGQLIQGFVSMGLQIRAAKKMGIDHLAAFSSQKYFDLVKSGFWLTIVTILTAIQPRMISVLAAEKMSAHLFGNFQLAMKLIEPATAVAAIVFSVNYSILRKTLEIDLRAFQKRYLKIGLLAGGVSALCAGLLALVPVGWFLPFFGVQYQEGIGALAFASVTILSATVLLLSVNYDTLKGQYGLVLSKYGIIFFCYIGFFWLSQDVSLKQAFALQATVPILVVAAHGLPSIFRHFKSIRK